MGQIKRMRGMRIIMFILFNHYRTTLPSFYNLTWFKQLPRDIIRYYIAMYVLGDICLISCLNEWFMQPNRKPFAVYDKDRLIGNGFVRVTYVQDGYLTFKSVTRSLMVANKGATLLNCNRFMIMSAGHPTFYNFEMVDGSVASEQERDDAIDPKMKYDPKLDLILDYFKGFVILRRGRVLRYGTTAPTYINLIGVPADVTYYSGPRAIVILYPWGELIEHLL